MTSKKSGLSINPGSSSGSPKSENIFYDYYMEKCRLLYLKPLTCVKPRRANNKNILCLNTGGITGQDWIPICKAIQADTSLNIIAIRLKNPGQYEFLTDVDTKEKAIYLKRRRGALYTSYIANKLVESLGDCLLQTDALVTLELDGVPVSPVNICYLLAGLEKNKTLKILKMNNCALTDLACEKLCMSLEVALNIKFLDLSSCELGPLSGRYIAKLIKYQHVNRFSQCSENSVQYEGPDKRLPIGLRRIKLNYNDDIGDRGANYILEEFDQEIPIEALEMQRCGISAPIAQCIKNIIGKSGSDLQGNEQLSRDTIKSTPEMLKSRQSFANKSEYKQSETSTSLAAGSSSSSVLSLKRVPAQSKLPVTSKKISSTHSSRSVETSTDTLSMHSDEKVQFLSVEDSVELIEMYELERARGDKLEIENEKLKDELERIKSTHSLAEKSPSQTLPVINSEDKSQFRSNLSMYTHCPHLQSPDFKYRGMDRTETMKKTVEYFEGHKRELSDLLSTVDIKDLDKIKEAAHKRTVVEYGGYVIKEEANERAIVEEVAFIEKTAVTEEVGICETAGDNVEEITVGIEKAACDGANAEDVADVKNFVDKACGDGNEFNADKNFVIEEGTHDPDVVEEFANIENIIENAAYSCYFVEKSPHCVVKKVADGYYQIEDDDDTFVLEATSIVEVADGFIVIEEADDVDGPVLSTIIEETVTAMGDLDKSSGGNSIVEEIDCNIITEETVDQSVVEYGAVVQEAVIGLSAVEATMDFCATSTEGAIEESGIVEKAAEDVPVDIAVLEEAVDDFALIEEANDGRAIMEQVVDAGGANVDEAAGDQDDFGSDR